MDISMHKGDTLRLDVSLTNNGEPWTPTNEFIVFSVGFGYNSPAFSVPVIDGVGQITHEQTKDLPPGNYKYDLRVYNSNKELVATPLFGSFIILGVVNNDI